MAMKLGNEAWLKAGFGPIKDIATAITTLEHTGAVHWLLNVAHKAFR